MRTIDEQLIQVPEGMVLVKGGCFDMGDTFGDGCDCEKPVHEVCVDDFYMRKYLVTQQEWSKVMSNNPSYFKGCENCPVENVSWYDVQEFIKRLNEKTGLNYRLPTEAEWEYAARSRGKKEKWAGTSEKAELGEYAWYYGNADKKTHPVGQKKPNTLELYDMSGNVWEWCSDCHDLKYYKNSPKNNPKGPSSGEDRVLRGGSWYNPPRFIRASYRIKYDPTCGFNYVGFRLAISAQ